MHCSWPCSVYARMYAITKDKKYLEFMDKEFHDTYNYLYDQDEHLFYRDGRYFQQRESNGKKIFWGRGNGWVLGGLVDLLKIIPKKSSYRPFYEKLYKEMCARIIETQAKDGYWHASLLDQTLTLHRKPVLQDLSYMHWHTELEKDTWIPSCIFLPSPKVGRLW